jgi:NitT/TauT family transport system ATP-binding protein
VVTQGADPFVTLDRVDLAYGGVGGATLAVQGLSMAIARQAFVAVVGPSGCGKSTLMKLATGLMPPTAGQVRVGGVQVTGPLKISGMAFQNPTLLPWRTTLENILLPLEIVEPHRRSFRRDRAANIEKARRLLRIVGLEKFADRYPWQLSGGMQQRANLCRALIHEPELLMLDEPFGALDAFTREELWGVLQELWMARRFTCVLVTHDLRESVFLADRVFVMSARPGRIIEARDVPIERPRTLARSFDADFVDIVHALRDRIAVARQDAA